MNLRPSGPYGGSLGSADRRHIGGNADPKAALPRCLIAVIFAVRARRAGLAGVPALF